MNFILELSDDYETTRQWIRLLDSLLDMERFLCVV